MNVIEAILAYDEAYRLTIEHADALHKFVTILSPDNSAFYIDSPFQSALAALIEGEHYPLWSWYCWWLYESEGEFILDGVQYNIDNYTLKEFLELLNNYYSK